MVKADLSEIWIVLVFMLSDMQLLKLFLGGDFTAKKLLEIIISLLG